MTSQITPIALDGFESHSLLDQAITLTTRAMALKPELNFNMQLARIYGEQGNIEKMFNSYIDFSEINASYINTIKREFSTFISENKENKNNSILRKILLKKIQTDPNFKWNDLLSWLFIQQKDYKKAFTQEKAIYKRQMESLRSNRRISKYCLHTETAMRFQKKYFNL